MLAMPLVLLGLGCPTGKIVGGLHDLCVGGWFFQCPFQPVTEVESAGVEKSLRLASSQPQASGNLCSSYHGLTCLWSVTGFLAGTGEELLRPCLHVWAWYTW